jgi:hypothetical protein
MDFFFFLKSIEKVAEGGQSGRPEAVDGSWWLEVAA